MPRTITPPKYRLHKPSGRAVVTITGKDHYLGRHGSAASKREYARLLAEWTPMADTGLPPVGRHDLTVTELLAAYWLHAKQKYGKRPSARSRLSLIKRATVPVRRLYGDTPAKDFGPLAFRAVRAKHISDGKDREAKKQAARERSKAGKKAARKRSEGYSRKYVTDLMGVVLRLFKWAASMELIPVTTYQALTTVGGLERGEAKETKPIRPPATEYVEAVRGKVSRQVRAMIDLQTLTGMRPGEVCIMRPADLDTTGELWTYRPQRHKTEHFGHERVIVLGPQAQEIIEPFLAGRATNAYLFTPAEAEAERRKTLHKQRETPLHHGNRPGTHRRRRPRRKPGERYTTGSYAVAIKRACDDLNVPRWSPNQLRHLAATLIRKQFGVEAARILLGHQHLKVTEIYAERDAEVARRVAAAVG